MLKSIQSNHAYSYLKSPLHSQCTEAYLRESLKWCYQGIFVVQKSKSFKWCFPRMFAETSSESLKKSDQFHLRYASVSCFLQCLREMVLLWRRTGWSISAPFLISLCILLVEGHLYPGIWILLLDEIGLGIQDLPGGMRIPLLHCEKASMAAPQQKSHVNDSSPCMHLYLQYSQCPHGATLPAIQELNRRYTQLKMQCSSMGNVLFSSSKNNT